MKLKIIIPLLFASLCASAQPTPTPHSDVYQAAHMLSEASFELGAFTATVIATDRRDWASSRTRKEIVDAAINVDEDRMGGMDLPTALDKECPHPLPPVWVTNLCATNLAMFACISNTVPQTNWIGVPITGNEHDFSLPHVVDGWHPEFELGLRPDGVVIWKRNF